MKQLAAHIAGLAALTALATSAWAYPSLNGLTGGGNLPTAEVAPAQTLTLALDLEDLEGRKAAQSWRALYGANDRFEASANFVQTERQTWGLDAKYVLCPGTAVGTLFGTTSSLTLEPRKITPGPGPGTIVLPRTNTYQLFALHTFNLTPSEAGLGLALTLGANWTSMAATGIDESAFRGFAVLQAKMGKVSIVGDYQTKDEDMESDAMWSAVARYQFSPQLGAEAGWSNSMGVLGSSDSRFFGGISYRMITD